MANKIVKLYRKFIYGDIMPASSDLEGMEAPNKEYLTLAEASTYTSLITSAIMHLVETGELQSYKGSEGPIFKVTDLDALMAELIIVDQFARMPREEKQAEDDGMNNLERIKI